MGLAVMFCFTAAAHFNAMRADLVRMVPPWVPNPELMVSFTGVCEILGAIGLLVRRTRRLAAIALIIFLNAVLPAKVHAATTQAAIGVRRSRRSFRESRCRCCSSCSCGGRGVERRAEHVPSKTPSEVLEVAGREVSISNPDKVLFPDAGYTKRDLAHYYLSVAEGALGEAGGRPMCSFVSPESHEGAEDVTLWVTLGDSDQLVEVDARV